MIMQIPRWRNVILLKSSLVPASSQSKTTRTHFASIHSTPIACDKRKSKRGDLNSTDRSLFVLGYKLDLIFISIVNNCLECWDLGAMRLQWGGNMKLALFGNSTNELYYDYDLELKYGMGDDSFCSVDTKDCLRERLTLFLGQDKRGFQQPSKDYIKFVRRQKRADEKRALKDFLYNDGPLRTFLVNLSVTLSITEILEHIPQPLILFFFSGQKFILHILEVIHALICFLIQHKDPIWSSNAEPPVGSRKRNEKAYARSAKKYHQDRTRSKLREESSAEDSGEPETVFHATFGSRWYTWSNKSCQRDVDI
ncbi:hypothetical protein DKX38_028966 [Salix brachista]|uniref:Uncharacterized protein n=1 Tax=Salix brachista TaxID=2182728 RepID=A0A5N5IXX0_9ROSI|nr:hypothetical protein DKX38_028966 [Salix brachista]